LTQSHRRILAFTVLAVLIVIFLSACGSTGSRALPAYEAPLARTDFQNVRTTAYTHTESDHTQYGARNALGGELHAAAPPIRRAENLPPARSASDSNDEGIQRVSNSGQALQPFSMEERPSRVSATRGSRSGASMGRSPKIGSAAADWSRWPAGTTFRLLSTGQIYRVDDYGWALSGRNTIDLYMATRNEMNNWGARREPIQILRWGDSQETLRFLAPRRNYPHVKRMILQLEGRENEAAAMR
jgi:3D (Asp-Asp-Asp) domain-containing protein